MLASILGLVTGLAGPMVTLGSKLADLKTAQLNAKNSTEKAEIERQIEETHDKKAVLVAEAWNRIGAMFNAGTRMFLAIPAGIVLWKLLVWDKVIGSFKGCATPGMSKLTDCYPHRTDALDPNMWWVVLGVVGFYFLMSRK